MTTSTELQTNPVPAAQSAGGAMMQSRQAQEVQAAMVIAQRFPRDETLAISKIETSCKRLRLAEDALWEYPRGGKKLEGPSIRLAEVIARHWGNLDCSVMELERRDGESDAMSCCWDLETNVRFSKLFTVRHLRDTKSGGKRLTDERDIYEIVANMGARRLRACIIAAIPGDVVDLAVEQVKKTLIGQSKEPLIDQIRKMVTAFDEQFQVSKAMIDAKLGHDVSAASPNQVAQLRRIYTALKDGIATREQHFDVTAKASDLDSLAKRAKESEGGASTDDLTKPADPEPEADPLVEAVAEFADCKYQSKLADIAGKFRAKCSTDEQREAVDNLFEDRLKELKAKK